MCSISGVASYMYMHATKYMIMCTHHAHVIQNFSPNKVAARACKLFQPAYASDYCSALLHVLFHIASCSVM